MKENKKITLVHDGPYKYTINYVNPFTGEREVVVFPEYKKGSKRERTAEVSMDLYYHLKDETSAFREGYVRVLTENVPPEIKETQLEAQQEVIDTTPEYAENSLTKEDIEKIMKGTKATIAKRFGNIENSSQKQFIIETIKELEIKNVDKLREVTRVLYGEEMELDYLFPEE